MERDKRLKDMPDVVVISELWRRRVEWLWNNCEETSGRPLDVPWLDEQIMREELGK